MRSEGFMSAEPHLYEIDPEHEREWAERLEHVDVSRALVVLEIGGRLYRLVPVDDADVRTTQDPAAQYDPEKALAAVEAGFGAFKGMDVEAFLAEILAEREQDTSQHSF
jgi:hypothetical protein